jgi:PAS domain S-box-containing protein
VKPASLSTRLLVWILPLSLAATFALALSTYLISRRVILWQAQQGIAAVNQAAAAETRTYFEQRHADLATIAQSPLFKDHFMNVEYGLAQEAAVYRREIEKMLFDLSRRAKAYPRLSYVDASGSEIVVIQDGRPAKPSRDSVDPAFTARVLKTAPGQRLTSPIMRVPFHDSPVVRYGAPLHDEQGRTRGALIFSASLAPVYAELERMRVGESGRTYLAPRGTSGTPAGDLLTAEAAIAGTPWSIVTAVERADYLGPLRGVSLLTLGFALVGAVLLVILLTRQVKLQLKPIGSLVEAADAYARGDLDRRVAVEGPIEVSVLADSFNDMAASLKARTQALYESETRYRAAVENSPHAVVGLDQHFRITLWNRRAEAFFGYQPSEAYGRTLALVLGEGLYKALERRVETEGSLRQIEAPGTTRDGRVLSLNLSWTGQTAPGGSREWFVVIQDETAKKGLEAQLIQAEKMTAVGNLIAGVAHELNNPLAAVTGYADLIKRLPLAGEEKEDLRLLCENAWRCRDIVQGLLAFVRKGETASFAIPINDVVQATIALLEYRLKKSEGIQLEVELDPKSPRIGGDFQRVQQVLVNLLGNACDALKGRMNPRVIRVRTRGLGREGCRVEIEDNGPGVPEGLRRKIFEPFFTTKKAGQGTGLGLSISAQIMAEFGGALRCEEAEGGGARFIADFPLPAEGLPEFEPEGPLPPAVHGKRVLVVDDEPHVAQMMARLLADDGLTAEMTTDPAAALDKMKAEEFDLVIADIDLGVMRGTQVFHAAQAFDKVPRFVFVTGDVLNQGLAMELALLAVPVLGKPFLRTDFLRVVRRVLQPSKSR